MAKLKQRSNGYFVAWYHGKQFLGKTEQEAKQKRDEYKYECEHGIEKPKPVTVIDLADKWMETKSGIEKRTYNQYVTVMEKLTDEIGDKLVSAVSPSDIKRVWKKYDELSQSYINKAKFLYKSFFQYAIDNRHCLTNPMTASSAKPHKGTKGTHRCLTDEEIRLIETVPHKMQTIAMFMLKAGLRRGEALALKKEDIHDGRIYINKAVQFTGNRGQIGQTKTDSSVRSVPLFAPLNPFAEWEGEHPFNTRGNHLATKKSFEQGWVAYMNTLSKAVNHRVSFRCHDLRHTFITKARDKGIDIHIVMNWVGHASEHMILQIYDHPSENREKDAVRLMEQ